MEKRICFLDISPYIKFIVGEKWYYWNDFTKEPGAMALTIIGREGEKQKLDKLLASKQAEFLALYGRRRVGKTFLIRQYLSDNLVFDISGTNDGSREQQLANFFGEYLKRTKGEQETRSPANWHEAFGYLAQYLAGLPHTTKQVVFIDEMPWLDTPKSEFVPALEFFWNQHVSNMNHVVLIACGSASSWILAKLINARGGLYNRITQRIRLLPFNLHETELFINSLGVHLPRYQTLELYMAMGGIPFYLSQISKGQSATQLIDALCFSPQGLLYDEYAQLYRSLFRNADHHIAVVESLARYPQGMTRMDIALKTKLSEGTLSRTLDELTDCDFITIFLPFANKKKDAVFKLTDFYSLFYLKFIHTNKGAGSPLWAQLATKSEYTAWSGYAFETICMVHVNQIKSALGIRGVYTRSSSWKFRGNDALPGAQIDLLIDRADQTINVCEAKFTNGNFALTGQYAAQLRLKKTIFRQATETKKAVFTTLLTTYPALKNKYYLEEIDSEVTMDKLFEIAD